jgi:hypothetical protein
MGGGSIQEASLKFSEIGEGFGGRFRNDLQNRQVMM